MIVPGTIPTVRRLVQRFAAPLIAACLLHMGLWMLIVSVAEPSAMSVLTKTVNWFIERFTTKAWPIEEMSWPPRFVAYQMAQGIVPIFVGLMIGWWILRRKPKTPQELL